MLPRTVTVYLTPNNITIFRLSIFMNKTSVVVFFLATFVVIFDFQQSREFKKPNKVSEGFRV